MDSAIATGTCKLLEGPSCHGGQLWPPSPPFLRSPADHLQTILLCNVFWLLKLATAQCAPGGPVHCQPAGEYRAPNRHVERWKSQRTVPDVGVPVSANDMSTVRLTSYWIQYCRHRLCLVLARNDELTGYSTAAIVRLCLVLAPPLHPPLGPPPPQCVAPWGSVPQVNR